ncbi:MAG: HEAT repeat domain-containing protein [Leptolyngbyaceae cyanobacterium bins.349]|nr:HEAT repeat domain-containing protein [Leptolyngbyaceae cyanobacterium bins.349]
MPAPDVCDYLTRLCNPSDQAWGDRYTPTEAELPLKVQTVIARPGDRTSEQQETSKRYEVLAGLREYAAQHVLLVGKPGSGKSTALRRLLWEDAQKALSEIENGQTDFTIPVLIELRDRREGSVVNWIQKALRRVTRDEAAIEDLLLEGRFLLLFDGLNEIPLPDIWSALDDFQRDRDFSHNPRIFTTRELGAGSDLGIEKKLEMLPLTEPQMREFIELRLPGQSDRLLRQLKDRLRELAETPLILQMLCDVVGDSPDGQLPQNRGELFRLEFAQRYEKFKPLRGRVSDRLRLLTPKLLQHLAFVMTQGDPNPDPCQPTPSWLSIPKSTAATLLAPYLANGELPSVESEVEMLAWIEAMLSHHLLQLATHPDEIEFRHQLFQEYYAAEKLLELLPILSDDELKQDYLNYLKWTEAIILLVGFLDEASALNVVELSLETDLQLGARLVGEVKSQFQSQLINHIASLSISSNLKIRLLGLTRSDAAIPPLLQNITESEELSTYSIAVKALGTIGSATASCALADLLRLPNLSIRQAAAHELRELSNDSALPILIQKLKDRTEDSTVRVHAAVALGSIGNESVSPSLTQVFLDNEENTNVRMNSVASLKKIKGEDAIPFLKIALEDEDNNISWIASNKLRELGGDEVKEILLEALASDNPWTRINAAFAIAQIGGKEVLFELIQAIKSELKFIDEFGNSSYKNCSVNVLSNLIQAIEYTNSLEAEPILLDLTGFKDPNISMWAVRALGKINGEGTIARLQEILSGRLKGDYFLSSIAAAALGSTGDEKVVPILIQALTDQASIVRDGAALGLAKLKNKEATSALLETLLDSEIRERAIWALGEIGDSRQEIVNSTLKFIDHTKPSIRTKAMEALWKLGSSEIAAEPLIEALSHDEEPSVRSNAARALGKIKNNQDKIYSALIQALSDVDINVRACVAETLGEFGPPTLLSNLKYLQIQIKEDEINSVIITIQKRCEFYSYEIAQAATERGNRQRAEGKDECEEVLSTIYSMILVMERNPETFRGIGEEALRDHFLVQLNGRYKGQATGETFNGNGKTDILLRVNGENIFIAECKFWGGERKLGETLDQLLRYATWRDTKLAMLIFNRNKNFSSVLQQIAPAIKTHPNFVREESIDLDKAQFRFVVCHPDDRDRELTLTILAFDIPT